MSSWNLAGTPALLKPRQFLRQLMSYLLPLESGGNAGSIETPELLTNSSRQYRLESGGNAGSIETSLDACRVRVFSQGWNLAGTPALLKLADKFVENVDKTLLVESGGNAGSIETSGGRFAR